jgi:LAO/AO transport system kinase
VTRSVAALVDATSHGDRAALARLLTIVESGGDAAALALTSLPRGNDAAILGVTGAPGAGKSTLTDRLVRLLRARGEAVAVLAVDPSSPFTGGAILGDRVRMQAHDVDDRVFVRSMASRGALGGLSRAAPHAVRVLAAAGYAWVIVETVGVGQVEVAVAGTADTTVVVVTPGWGDAIQANKAGLLEVGDVFVVNKADRDGVEATVADLRGMLALGSGSHDGAWVPPVLTTVATEGQGVDELLDAVETHRDQLRASGDLVRRRERRAADELRGIVVEWVTKQVDDICSGPGFGSVVAQVAAGTVDPYTAATELVSGQRSDSAGRA